MALEMYLLMTLVSGNLALLGIGGGVHYWYYVKNSDKQKQWKMQPDKFLSKKLAREEMLLGLFNFNLATAG